MQAADLSAVLLIEQEQLFPWTAQMLQDCLQANYLCLVLEVKQEIIGFTIMMLAGRQADLLNIAIKTAYHRQGYGRILLTHVLTTAREKCFTHIYLEVRISNQAAIDLYQQAGFKEIASRKNYYPALNGKEDAVIMSLALVSS